MLLTLKIFSLFSRIPFGIVLITVIYWSIFLLMHPLYNSAWWDDFTYIRSAEKLILSGQLIIHEWSTTQLISQIVWGAVISSILGFSIVTLKISVVILFFFALIAFYFMLRVLSVDKFYSTWFTLLLLAYPWSILFAYSYMTEVPYISWFILSMYFYVKGLNKHSLISLFIGSIFSSLAILTRQTAIIIPLSIFIALMLKALTTKQIREIFSTIIASTVFPIIVYFAYLYWLSIGDNKTVIQIEVDLEMMTIVKSILSFDYNSKTNVVYSNAIANLGFYLTQFLGTLWPIFLIFSPSIFRFKKKLSVKSLIIYLGFFAISVFLILFQNYQKIGWVGIDNLGGPRELFYFTRWFWVNNLSVQEVWGWSVILSLPLFSFLFMKSSLFILKKYFSWKLRISRKVFCVFFVVISIGVFSWFFVKFGDLRVHYSTKEILVDLWLFFTVRYLILMFILLAMSGIRIKKLDNNNIIIVHILLLVFVNNILLFVILPNYWPRYITSFIPLLIISFALFSRHLLFSKTRLIIVTILMLTVSFVNAKGTHTFHGAIWQVAETMVYKGVDPQEINTEMMAWYPYWYYGKQYEEAILLGGGDKRKIRNPIILFDPTAESMDYKVVIRRFNNKCPQGSLVQLQIKTLFINQNVCGSLSSSFK